jgi:hypothetical protein
VQVQDRVTEDPGIIEVGLIPQEATTGSREPTVTVIGEEVAPLVSYVFLQNKV